MKLLTTEQQNALREFIVEMDKNIADLVLKRQAAYWGIELKPKRVRRLTPPQSD